MAIKLTKGQTISLEKDKNDLSSITLGLGWKVRKKAGLLGGLFGGKQAEYDLDAIAFMLDANDKLTRWGNDKLVGGDIVFYNSLEHPSRTVIHKGDNRTGGDGAKDDETILVHLNSVPQVYHRILFLVSIYKGIERKQHFGMVDDAYIRAIDAKGAEIARYALSNEPSYQGACTMVFGEVYRHGGGWKFRAIGDAHPFDSFVHLLKKHVP